MIAKFIYVLLALGALAFFLRSRSPVRVTLTSEGVTQCEGLTKPVRTKLARFAQESLQPGEIIQLQGQIGNQGRIRWQFPRSIDPDFAQRLRNFMANEVYM